MCGRYGVSSDFKIFGIDARLPGFHDSYNATPGSFLPVLLKESPLHAELMKWGLIPSWSKEFKVKFSTINARAETIATSPVFRSSFNKKRCLIPTIGFHEWRKNSDGTKTPFHIRLKNRPVFAFAGIWDTWKDAEEKEFRSYAIITTEANEIMKPIHHRMPVIIPKADQDAWTNVDTPMETIVKMLKQYDDKKMEVYEISSKVNNPRNDDPTLIEPI